VLKNIIFSRSDHQWGPNNYFEFPLHGGTGGLFSAFQPYIEDRLHLSKEAVEIDPKKKTVRFQDGETTDYDVLISTMPINDLVFRMTRKSSAVSKAAAGFHWSSGLIAGIGIKKPCPSKKNWMYFPQDDSPFYRVTYLSNYSPNMTPKPRSQYFSFLCETSYSVYKRENKKKIIDKTIQGLINSKLLAKKDVPRIVSKYLMDVKYSFPVPYLKRDKHLNTVQPFLENEKIYSRGRFGGWKYEVGNMDHSIMQGVEVVDRILKRKKEETYTW
jgi:protoporphyrinogen oxidase